MTTRTGPVAGEATPPEEAGLSPEQETPLNATGAVSLASGVETPGRDIAAKTGNVRPRR